MSMKCCCEWVFEFRQRGAFYSKAAARRQKVARNWVWKATTPAASTHILHMAKAIHSSTAPVGSSITSNE